MMIIKKLTNAPVWVHGGCLAGSLVVFQTVKAHLDALYALSGHPVDYATGQIAFDGDVIKGYYAHMQELGSLKVYVATQQFDYVFMVTLALFGVLLGSFVARFGRVGSWGRRLGFAAATLAVLGAVMDALENLVSFVMLAQPQDFADWLALPYSGFASLKFAMITLAMLAVLLGLCAVLIGRGLSKPKIA